MSEQQVNNVLGNTIEKIKEVVDVNTAIGNPIQTADGTTIIPVSQVSYGFGSGGSDLPAKKAEAGKDSFLGGAGAGVTIKPIAFLVVSSSDVKIMQIEPYTSAVDRAIEKVPEVMDKVSGMFPGKKKGKEAESKE